MTIDFKALAAQAAQVSDQTKAPERSDFEVRLPAAGKTVARLIEYIELGKHDGGEFKGKKKPDCMYVRLVFELLAPKNIREEDVNGTPTKFADRITLNNVKLMTDPKAGFAKLFKAMAYGRDGIQHMSQMLGDAFVLNVIHNTVKKEGQPDKTYANIKDDSGTWQVSSPFHEDPITGDKQALPVPAPVSPLKLFLWDVPNKECWDSLFIDGTRTVKDGEVEREVSKNWLQEKILTSRNFTGSPLEAMLLGLGDLPTIEGAVGPDEGDTPVDAPETGAQGAVGNGGNAPAEQAGSSAGAGAGTAPSGTASAAPAGQSGDDALAALGLAG